MNPIQSSSETHFDVLIIGAGPAGLGVAVALQACGVKKMAILEAKTIGASFGHWPKQMRLITPSFYSNPFKHLDLNAITPDTSPADFLRSEHPTGAEYATYLRAVASHHQIDVRCNIRVEEIRKDASEPNSSDSCFELETSSGRFTSRFVVWAAGEYFYPLENNIDGAEHCIHNTKVTDWNQLSGNEFAVIGGYESGIDAAIHLLRAGKTVHLFSRGEPWGDSSTDPSAALSPYTRDRLRETLPGRESRLHLYRNADISRVLSTGGKWVLFDRDEIPFTISTQPILATGFLGSLMQVIEHFEIQKGRVVFTEEADESTITPNLFYSGPLLQHREAKFCFIYKFRARFGVIAREIATRLSLDVKALEPFAEMGMLQEDLECCTNCECAIPSAAEPQDARARAYSKAAAERTAPSQPTGTRS
ncbi:NAD(P)-binding domain-containing protein [Luteolibacter pohnpeiensis]|uniref:NAD(P)-binding domain-containing protein n=1 Tax=Luteolibacter pohnpeiensis TaxID=454153 RepID=A0A934SDA1_9BACT|nr:NAD(P)/FAD-dependent oxidoreductase [Luteolibacter pohnpeiensis]MBK1883764.1 NAD(P)-binding domain-containing protein [Luteolibacter pohnpeiensis]